MTKLAKNAYVIANAYEGAICVLEKMKSCSTFTINAYYMDSANALKEIEGMYDSLNEEERGYADDIIEDLKQALKNKTALEYHT